MRNHITPLLINMLLLLSPPAGADEPATTVDVVAPATAEAPSDGGWALEAAVLGFAAAGATLGMGIAADAWMGEEVEAGPFGMELGAVVAIGAVNPVIVVGGMSARESGDVEGCPGCRIAGWVLFPTHAAAAVATITLHFALEDPVPHGVVAGMVGLGSISNVLFAADALASHEEALQKGPQDAAERPQPAATAIVPVVAPLTERRGVHGAMVGVSIVH